MGLMSPDVIVVGAGAIGASIAYQLSKAGVKVMVFDRGPIAGEATGASGGIISARPGPDTPEPLGILFQESARLYPALAAELYERTGIDIGLRRSGLLRVAYSETEEHDLRAGRHWQIDHGAVMPWLDQRSAIDVEPALNPSIRAALHDPDVQQVIPRVFAQASARAAADLGATLREGVTVFQLLLERDRVVGVGLGSETIRADEVVVANGAWAGGWSQQLHAAIPVRPVRGQMASLQTVNTALRVIVMSQDGYALSKADGSTIVGTTVEDAGYDSRPTTVGVARLLMLAPRLAPRLADATFRTAWAGLRPATPDGRPMIGRLPDWRGVTLATGHFRDGILLAPITAELVTDLLLSRRPRTALDAFDPARFVVRAA
jgi:glycine oxidase